MAPFYRWGNGEDSAKGFRGGHCEGWDLDLVAMPFPSASQPLGRTVYPSDSGSMVGKDSVAGSWDGEGIEGLRATRTGSLPDLEQAGVQLQLNV